MANGCAIFATAVMLLRAATSLEIRKAEPLSAFDMSCYREADAGASYAGLVTS
eukprot:CAMPEP_0117538822 /NCGR_PEP_ID=MMETSP0784-20121206/42674_1 /TAXON_ID=39447 /ORGANISM="" /LENGTH=52 /DNA_ID=CAMNT_0005335443 /DNA_START=18 /DNA_END=173 /DNA_ORIENTATION=+